MAKKQDRKQCFVVGPIGDDDSEDRIHADWLLEEIILPVFREHYADFDVTRADKVSNPGLITSQVITALLEADLVIADLTTLNPNAFYEVGIRHVLQKPIIHMHLEGQRIPFDVAPFRSIKFSRRRPADIRAARELLILFLKEALDPEHQVDNPVTFARGRVEFDKHATPSEKVVQEQLEAVLNRISALERSNRSSKNRTLIIDALMRKAPSHDDVILRLQVSATSTQSTRQLYDDVESVAAACFSAQTVSFTNQMESFVEVNVTDTLENRHGAQTFADILRTKGYSVKSQLPPREGSLF